MNPYEHFFWNYAFFYRKTWVWKVGVSDFRFPAPVSYWETGYHAREFFWISHTLMAGLILLWLGWKLKRFLQRKRPLPRRWHGSQTRPQP